MSIRDGKGQSPSFKKWSTQAFVRAKSAFTTFDLREDTLQSGEKQLKLGGEAIPFDLGHRLFRRLAPEGQKGMSGSPA